VQFCWTSALQIFDIVSLLGILQLSLHWPYHSAQQVRNSDDAGAVLCGSSCGGFLFNEVSDQASCPFDKCEFVRKAALKQYAYTIMPNHVRRGDQRDIFADAEVNQVIGLGQNEKVPRYRRLDLRQLAAEILHEDLLEPTAELHRLFTDQLEALVEFLENPPGDEDSRVESFFYFGILRDLAELLKDLSSVLCASPHIAEQDQE